MNQPRVFLFFISLSLLSGCKTATVLKDAALYDCGTGTVYLSGWWANAPDKSVIQMDPAGGYQFAYWVDADGNACHGDPGRNGQVGPAVVLAYKPQASTWAVGQSSITEAQLKALQEIPVPFEKYDATGLHFVQFDNTIWRDRADGKMSQVNSSGVVSIPDVVDIGKKACVAPAAFRPAQGLGLPSFSPGAAPPQDPNRCKVRALPTGAAMTEAERKKADVFDLPHGKEVFNVPN